MSDVQSRGPRGSGRRVSPRAFPGLSAFFAGYLHQDFIPEHGSAPSAARAFLADASDVERRQVAEELRRLMERTRTWPLEDLQRAVSSLGAAWMPASREELAALLTADS